MQYFTLYFTSVLASADRSFAVNVGACVPSTFADVVIFRTQISRESGFRSSGHRLAFSYDLPLFFETFVRLFKKPVLNFLTIYPTFQRRLKFNKI